MWILELFVDLAELIDDIRHAKRFGWGGFLWNLLGFACLVIAAMFFTRDLHILGIIGSIGCIACFVLGGRQTIRDIRKTREAEQE